MAVGLLVPGVLISVLAVWAVLAAAVLGVCAVGSRRERRLKRALAWLEQISSPSREDIDAALDVMIGRLPLDFVMARLADPCIPDDTRRQLSQWLIRRWGERLAAWASSSTKRSARRRVDALRVFVNAESDPRVLPLLREAVSDSDPRVADAAVNLLARVHQRGAAEALVGALRSGRLQASRVATALDQFPLPIADLLVPLTSDANPAMRFWATTLLARYGEADDLTGKLGRLVHDRDPRVRKAAVETLGTVGSADAASLALTLLGDPVWYVRAHAARALGDLGRADLAEHVLPLLADGNWWVRQAAKESLEEMGPSVWRDVIKYLDHTDAFARNGAAEVLQNLGILDSLIVLEATSRHPAPDKVDMLKKIAAAGGARMTSALLERSDAQTAQRIRALLDMLGMTGAGV